MLKIEISYDYNDNEINIVQIEQIVIGIPETEDTVRKLVDRAKAKFIAALNA